MEYPHYAAVDIGSNAVRLLIKRLEDPATGRFGKVVMLRVPLRLGQDVFTRGYLSDTKLQELVDLISAFKLVIGIYKVEPGRCRLCATSAMREATNSADVVRAVKDATGFTIDIISGQEEASIVSILHSPTDRRKLVYVDVGGGSTEVSVMRGDETFMRKSFRVGTVRILNNAASQTWREEMTDKLRTWELDPHVGREFFDKAVIVGAGGNINKLFGLAQERDTADCSMSVETLRTLYNELSALTVEQRMINYKLKADRADVIVPAAQIFLTIADALGISSIEIPSDGLSDGIVVDLWRRENSPAATAKTA